MRWPSCFPCRRRRASIQIPAFEDGTSLFEDFPRDPPPASVPRRGQLNRAQGPVAFDSRVRMDGLHHTPQHHSRVPHRGILRNAHRASESQQARVPPHLFRDAPRPSWDRPDATPSPPFPPLPLDDSFEDRPARLPPHLFRDAPATRPPSNPHYHSCTGPVQPPRGVSIYVPR